MTTSQQRCLTWRITSHELQLAYDIRDDREIRQTVTFNACWYNILHHLIQLKLQNSIISVSLLRRSC